MPVTRHFYESGEVVEALRWSVVLGRVTEAAFWCEELVCSGEEGRAWGALFSVWLEQALIVVPDWADVWFGAGADIQEACAELCHTCRGRRDISLPLVLLIGRTQVLGPPPEGVPVLPAKLHPFRTRVGGGGKGGVNPLYDYFERACASGKAQAAWWAAQQLGHTLRDYPLPSAGRRLFDYLDRLVLPGDLDGWRLTFMCAAVLLECEGHLKPFKSLPKRTGKSLKPTVALERWEGLEGRRVRREFAIPREALLCVTERGRMRAKEGTLGNLYRIHERLEAGEGCGFWADVLATYADEKGWVTEEAQEAFYEFAFPDDIPDEWSKADQLKSHGPGCLSSSEEPRWSKWGRQWLDADAVFAWGIPTAGLLELLSAPVAGMETWLDAAFTETERDEERVIEDPAVLALLTPVRKMLLVE